MIKLLKLYSYPERFKPITFTDGVNIILGEKVPEELRKTKKDRKTNGVGKSMSIEFINFCLLRDVDNSRVMKIPIDKFPEETLIKLDLIINGKQLTISRSKHNPDKPVIDLDGEPSILFSKLEDAATYLGDLFYQDINIDKSEKPSFRELMGPIIRDEGSEFKDIINCYDSELKIANVNLIKTHLYFFGIQISTVKELKVVMKKMEDISKTFNYLKSRLTDGGNKKMNDVKAELNALESDLSKAGTSLDDFKSDPIFQQNQESVTKLDEEIELIRLRQAALRVELRRIETMPKVEGIDLSDIQIVYDKFKSGLGQIVSESIEQVLNFKKKIEKYQNSLINDKAKSIRDELLSISTRITTIDNKRSEILKDLDSTGLLKDFKNGFTIYNQKKEELRNIVVNLQDYEITEREIKGLKIKKQALFSELDDQRFEIENVVKSFNQSLITIHDYIMGNSKLSFDIDTVTSSKSKQIINFDFRILDDGSRSVDKVKVFIYDIALMLNEYTRQRHPLFLIHDNIFDVDQDTLTQSLNFLAEQEDKGLNFQYILTLNRDKIENEERVNQIKLNIDKHTRANFTRQETFLRVGYQEM